MQTILQVIGTLVVLYFAWVMVGAALQFLTIPMSLFALPGQLVAGSGKDADRAKGKFLSGSILAFLGLLAGAYLLVGLSVSLAYFFRADWPRFPSWLLWTAAFLMTLGIFTRAASGVTKGDDEEGEDFKDKYAASILAWNLVWLCSPVLFLVLALKPEVIHASMEWMPYAQYAPGEEQLEEPYRVKIKETWTDLQKSTTASAPDMTKLTELFKTDKARAKLQFGDWLDASLSQFRLYVGSIEALHPPRRLQDFHSAFKTMYANLLATYESITTKFRQEGDMSVFESGLETMGQQMQDGMREIQKSLRQTNYGPEDFFPKVVSPVTA